MPDTKAPILLEKYCSYFFESICVFKKKYYLCTAIENSMQHIGVVVQLVRIPACHAGGRGFESRPYRREPKTKGDKRKTSPSNSLNLKGFFYVFCLSRKSRKRQKTTK